jgi:hypothetical protein
LHPQIDVVDARERRVSGIVNLAQHLVYGSSKRAELEWRSWRPLFQDAERMELLVANQVAD